MSRRELVLVPLEPNQNEVFLLAICVISALTGLAAPNAANAPDTPAWTHVLWYGLLLTAGLAGLAGIYWPDPITGMLILRSALVPVGAGAYAQALLLLPPWHATDLLAGAVVAGFGVCAHRRAWRLTVNARTSRRRSP